MTTVHCYGDSGPYTVWGEGPIREAKSYEVPDHLWTQFESARRAHRAAERQLEDYCTLLHLTEHGAATGHDGFVRSDHLVRCVTCHHGWYLSDEFASSDFDPESAATWNDRERAVYETGYREGWSARDVDAQIAADPD